MRSFGVFVLVCLVSFNSHALFGIGKKKAPPKAPDLNLSWYHTIRTVEGCSINVTGLWFIGNAQYSWSGSCPGGKADGIGWINHVRPGGVRTKSYVVQTQKGKVIPRSLYYGSGWPSFGVAEPQSSVTPNCSERTYSAECSKLISFIQSNSPFPELVSNDGCRFESPRAGDFLPQVRWSGRCENGLAEGYGYVELLMENEKGKLDFEFSILVRFNKGKRLNGSYMSEDMSIKSTNSKVNMIYRVDGLFAKHHLEFERKCSSIKPCKELMAAKAAGGRNPEGMAPVSDFMPPVADTRGGGDRPPAFNPNPNPNRPATPAQPPAGNAGSSVGGLYGTGKYKAPVMPCDDALLDAEMAKFVAREQIVVREGICINAKSEAKMWEFQLNLFEGSCPGRYEEYKDQVRMSFESAKAIIRGNCHDTSY